MDAYKGVHTTSLIAYKEDYKMTNITTLNSAFGNRIFDTLFRRSIGYDYLPDLIENWTSKSTNIGNFPPYDIEKTGENNYALTLALAGYAPDDIEITTKDNRLFVNSKHEEKTTEEKIADVDDIAKRTFDNFLYKGIAKRSFKLSYALGEYMEVHDATFENGLLTVHLERIVPEEKKPRQIPIIGKSNVVPALETKEAA